MMMHLMFVVSLPRARRCADTDGVNIRAHGVLNIRWHIQEASNRIRLRPCLIEYRSNSNLQSPRNYRDSGILIVKVVLPMTSGKEKRVSKRLTRCIFVAF